MNNANRSVVASRIITDILLGVVILCICLLPLIMKAYFHYRQMPSDLLIPLLVLCYGCAVCAAGALWWLHRLLTNIAKGQLFNPKNSRLLRDLSTYCLLIGILTVIGSCWYFPCILIAVAAVFLFLIFRVLQSVFAAATQIKNENDMTI